MLPLSCAPDLADPILSFSNFQWNNRKAIAHLVRLSTARACTIVAHSSAIRLQGSPDYGSSLLWLLRDINRAIAAVQLSSPASLYPGYFDPPSTTEKFGLQVQYGLVNDFSAMDNNVVANPLPDISPLLARAVVDDATSNATAAKVATLVATVAASSTTDNSKSKPVSACCWLRWATINLVACCRRRQGKGDARGLR